MNNSVVIAYDEEDHELGDFFTACKTDVVEFLTDFKNIPILLTRGALNEVSVSFQVEQISNFLFAAFSHGTENSLTIKGNAYVSTNINIDLFDKSFFYTCSCLTGKVLGLELCGNGCYGFIGYKEKFNVWGFNVFPFVDCATYGFKVFCQGYTMEQTIESMKTKYNYYIDNYQNDMFGKAMLVSNREALVGHGKNISLKDLV